MIKIYRGPVLKNGKSAWRAADMALVGFSRQPLLDACRELKRMGVDCRREVALFREGATDWDLKTTVGYGASIHWKHAAE